MSLCYDIVNKNFILLVFLHNQSIYDKILDKSSAADYKILVAEQCNHSLLQSMIFKGIHIIVYVREMNSKKYTL